MWYQAKAAGPFSLGKRRKQIKQGDTIFWTPSAATGKVILFNGKHAHEVVTEEEAARMLDGYDAKTQAPSWGEVTEKYMDAAVR